ncbi:MAG TPA: hypothetical protein VJN02_03255, partial [Gammaproteobacteria bacterium]|nr:hypothetical protein [Gammaproteobacteria bacterium]
CCGDMQTLIETLRDCWGYIQQHGRIGIPQNTYPENIMQQLAALKWIILQGDRYCVTQSGLDFLAELESLEALARRRKN